MRKWLLGAVCAALVIAVPKEAPAFVDGHEMLEVATSEDTFDRISYLKYVEGVVAASSLILAAYELPPAFCVVGTPYGDMADAVRIWLRRNPQLLDAGPAVIVITALNAHFPCESEADNE